MSDLDELVTLFTDNGHEFRIFMAGVVAYIGEHPELNRPGNEVVHSFKSRLKDVDHLRAKIIRKRAEGRDITSNNLFLEITDLAGVRILHLFQEQFQSVDAIIRKKVEAGDWVLAEIPKAYTWDPEAATFLEDLTWRWLKNLRPTPVCTILCVHGKTLIFAVRFR